MLPIGPLMTEHRLIERKEDMLKESVEFDSKMIHEKYEEAVEKAEKGEKCRPEK